MNITTTRIIKRANRPALRLINTKDLSHLGLLSVQKKGIGSGDAAAAVGLHPYQSPLELWLIKTGRDPGFKKPTQMTQPPLLIGVAYWSLLWLPPTQNRPDTEYVR